MEAQAYDDLKELFKCICAECPSLTPERVRTILEAGRDYGVQPVIGAMTRACRPSPCTVPGSIPGLPPGIPPLPPGTDCPSGDCGQAYPGAPSGTPPGSKPLPNGTPSGGDRPPDWVCASWVGAIFQFLGPGGVPGMNFTYDMWKGLCSGVVPWSKVKSYFCSTVKLISKAALLPPFTVSAPVLIGLANTLCPDAPEQVKMAQLVSAKQPDSSDVLDKILNPTGSPGLGGIIDILSKQAPVVTGNPYTDLLTAILANSGQKESVLSTVLGAMGIPIGPTGEIQPDNGQVFMPHELAMMASGLIGGLIGIYEAATT